LGKAVSSQEEPYSAGSRTSLKSNDPLSPWRTSFVFVCLFAFALVTASIAQDLIAHGGGEADTSSKIWLLDVGLEQSVFTWLSVTTLFFAAFLFFVCGRAVASHGGRLRWHWYFLAAVFLLLSMDDAISIHEKISEMLESRIDNTGLLHFAWAAPAGVISLLGLIAFIPFIRSFPPRLAVLLLLSAAVFLGGAVGLEMVNGSIAEVEGASLRYRMLTNVEEGLEVAGVMMLIYALLSYRDQHLSLRPAA
jgi:hypothetical protein